MCVIFVRLQLCAVRQFLMVVVKNNDCTPRDQTNIHCNVNEEEKNNHNVRLYRRMYTNVRESNTCIIYDWQRGMRTILGDVRTVVIRHRKHGRRVWSRRKFPKTVIVTIVVYYTTRARVVTFRVFVGGCTRRVESDDIRGIIALSASRSPYAPNGSSDLCNRSV